jgi:hypothetical protein
MQYFNDKKELEFFKPKKILSFIVEGVNIIKMKTDTKINSEISEKDE